jgi:putative transposase
VLRYAERNPLRANLVERAEQWLWSSLRWWVAAGASARAGDGKVPGRPLFLCDWPVDRPARWVQRVNQAQSEAELEALRRCVSRGRPFGEEAWVARAAARLGLEHTLRGRGRPRKKK